MCNNTASRCMAWGFSVVVLAYSMVSQADPLPGVELAKVAATVEQMVAIDTRIALIKEQQRELEAMGIKPTQPVPSLSPVAAPMPKVAPVEAQAKKEPKEPALPEKPKAPVLSVEGIFGPGDQLFANVLIDGREVRFKKNQRYPIGYDSSFPYQLVSIEVPCVRLTGPQGLQKVCVDGL